MTQLQLLVSFPPCGDKSAGLPICTAQPPKVSHRDVANARLGWGVGAAGACFTRVASAAYLLSK